ncbi:protein tipE [Condylostylus longicornis]|uniref:protein tipE n=1 Tax=Condylostylus longicornis TaxID=2530218 RepID=UPI00244E5947|nr:protein tipE [Condylostylus longicornis]XP_055373390.1 protein tipE [Condylostylus longicornis]
MGDEVEIRTLRQKLLFYTTAFFILLATFSLFSFLFLVPFVIDPAFTTIFMQFDENPALCITYQTIQLSGTKNCTWSSCREGCTRDIYNCTQIRVNYKLNLHNYTDEFNWTDYHHRLRMSETEPPPVKRTDRYERAIREYDYIENEINFDETSANFIQSDEKNNFQNANDKYKNIRNSESASYYNANNDQENDIDEDGNPLNKYNDNNENNDNMVDIVEGFLNDSEWYYGGAKLFPNVKGCGYPPMLNCTIWAKRYIKEGTKFPCYYSKVDPGLVISDLDYWQNTLNLVYSMAIPIPSFIISIIYLTFAYFKIYNEDEEAVPLDKNAEDMATGDDEEDLHNFDDDCELNEGDDIVEVIIPNGITPISATGCLIGVNPGSGQITNIINGNGNIGPLTPMSNIDNSFGTQLQIKMADEASRESLDNGASNSGSIAGNISKTMTTSISTPPGPTAAV